VNGTHTRRASAVQYRTERIRPASPHLPPFHPMTHRNWNCLPLVRGRQHVKTVTLLTVRKQKLGNLQNAGVFHIQRGRNAASIIGSSGLHA